MLLLQLIGPREWLEIRGLSFRSDTIICAQHTPGLPCFGLFVICSGDAVLAAHVDTAFDWCASMAGGSIP